MKKHGLFKILSLTIVGLLVISWFVKASYYSGSEMVDLGLYRIGLYELFNYPFLSVQFFIIPIVFIITVAAFYGVLGKTGKYRSMVEKLAAKFKGKEILFLIIASFVLAALQSVFGYGLLLFIFIPFICSVILQLGYDKMTALIVSFISILIGTIGSTFDPTIVNTLEQVTGYTANIIPRIGLFVICYVVYLLFLIKYAKKAKTLNDKKDDKEIDDAFLGERKNNKKPIWPLIVILSLVFVVLVLGATNWETIFNITWFNEMHTAVKTWAIGEDYTVAAYIFGNFLAFGSWTFTDFSLMLIMASFILKLIYGIKINDFLDGISEYIGKIIKPVGIIVLAYVVVIITAYHPFFATIAAWITDLTSKFNIITTTVVTALGSFLNIEMVYLSQSSIPYIASTFTSDAALNSLTLISQSIYGLSMIVAPTSIILILGLEYLNIPYTKWMKSSWKFIVELLVLILECLSTK